jgi:choline transport protein
MVISELTSMMPIACGQYYWVHELAPSDYYRNFSSYVIGWLTSLAWAATVAIETLLAGTIVQGLIKLNYPTYDAKLWQGTLLTWAVIAVTTFINVFMPNFFPKLEIMILVLHVVGFVAIVTALLSTAELGSASSVWLTAFNGGGWPTQGLSLCVGFLGNIATFVGADASVHMAEEVANAELTIPRAICMGMIFDGIVGFAMMVAVLYCLGDANSVRETPTRFPFIQIFYNSVKSLRGATVMSVVVLILTWGCAAGITATASRMTWSFARDKGMPFSRYLKKVTKNQKIPIVAILVTTIFAALLVLIYIASDVAFNDVISLTITGFYGSYFLPCAFLLYHRVKGHILPHGSQLPRRLEQSAPVPLTRAAPDKGAEIQVVPDKEAEIQAARDKGAEIQAVPAEEDETRSARDEEDGNWSDPDEGAETQATPGIDNEFPGPRFVWGPWRLPGIFGTINNAYACVYMIYVIFWSVWPPATPVFAETMNYSVVVTGGVMILSGVWYVVRGHREYKGPIVEV